MMNKKIYYDRRARKEYLKLPPKVQNEFDILIEQVKLKGFLGEPNCKKLSPYILFELRVNTGTIWRCFYAEVSYNEILLLSFFQKKSQKTPRNEIKKAIKRLNYY